MFPMSSSLGFPAMSPMFGGSAAGMMPQSGSSATDFMSGINSLTYNATHNTDGTDILTWANGLVQQAQIRKQQQALQQQQQSSLAGLLGGASGAASGTSGQPDMNQLMQFLMMLMGGLGQK